MFQTDPPHEHRRQLVILDGGPVPDVLQQLSDAARLRLDVSHGRTALNCVKSDGFPLAVVLSAPAVHLARVLESAVAPGSALDSWRVDTEANLAALQQARDHVVVLERGCLESQPMQAVGRLTGRWMLPVDFVLRPTLSVVEPAPLMQMLAVALLRVSGRAGSVLEGLEEIGMPQPVLSSDLVLRACDNLAELDEEVNRARAEALTARAGRRAAELREARVIQTARSREAVLAALLLDHTAAVMPTHQNNEATT